ncbi:hypothetical protein OIU78_007338 [Salix suchowensis]|nr:hypothetical protein OIU78_007338 [Salix suchowensis]
MTTKVKGLLRGLRYISQIFDEKEQEMQIGFPTDVKACCSYWMRWSICNKRANLDRHPHSMSLFLQSSMNEFNSPPELPCGTSNSKEEVKSLSTDPHSEDTIQTEKPKHRSRRSSGSGSSLLNSPDRRSAADSSRNSRHQASSSTGSPLNSPRGTDAPKSSRQSPTHEQPSIPKHSRGRKSRGSPGSGPSKSKEKKSSKEAAPFSDPGSGGCESMNGRTNPASQLSSVLEAREEEG